MLLYFLTEFLSKHVESGLILKIVPLITVIAVVLSLLGCVSHPGYWRRG